MNINHTYQKSMIVGMIILLLGASIGSSINEKEHKQSNQINQTSSRFLINTSPTSSEDDLSYETVKTNNYQNTDPADIRIESNQLDLEWPEYAPPPTPPNTPPDPQNPYNVITTKEHQEIETRENTISLYTALLIFPVPMILPLGTYPLIHLDKHPT